MNDGGTGSMTISTIAPTTEDTAGNPGDLRPWAGMEVALQDGPLLSFGAGVVTSGLEQRTAAELAPVLQAPESGREQDVIYTVYRGIGPKEILPEIQRRGLVYVALAMRPGTIGAEWVRTRGHTNPDARATSIAYPEVHEVWSGEGLLYLQNEAVSDIVTIPLRAGEKAVVAPGWACLLANVGELPLVVGTWRTADCIPQTDALTARGGMAHYVLPGTVSGLWTFAANPKYQDAPVPRTITPQDLPDFGLKHDEPMLTTFHANPDFLRFLLRPQDYSDVWARVYGEKVC
jgi:glucose-6-phosphate isomerase